MNKWQQDYLQSGSSDAHLAVRKGRPKAFWISCPECGFWTDVCKVALLRRGRWRAVPCAHCNGNRAASRWKCACNKRWAVCETHSCVGRTCGVRTHLKVQTPKRVMPSCFDVDSEGYPIDKPRKIKKAKVCRALEFPPLQQEEQQSAQQFGIFDFPFDSESIAEPALVQLNVGVRLKRKTTTTDVFPSSQLEEKPSQLKVGFRLRKKTRIFEAHAVTSDVIHEQGTATVFVPGNMHDDHPTSGVKRKAVNQRVPRTINRLHFRKYLEDHPIAAVNRLRAARDTMV